MVTFAATLLLHLCAVSALRTRWNPGVQLDQANVVGRPEGSTESFLGIPYAQPPIRDLRLRLPQIITSYNGTINATSFGNQCIQQAAPLGPNIPSEVLQGLSVLGTVFDTNVDVPQSEDCLNLNIIRPANVSRNEKLPVLFWIYGGGFGDGSNSMAEYNGTVIVQRSIEIGEPVIWVAVNYRLHVFGFLGGHEVKEAGLGNLGLHDQRTALRWVQKYIHSFGGDPEKVTIWGESAGAMSVFLQMSANHGDPGGLFRAGIMSSGSAIPAGDIDSDLQDTYDFVVQKVQCANATDTLACLRTVPAAALLDAANNTTSVNGFQGLATPYMPRADGKFVTVPPQELVEQRTLAKIPFIIGDVQDEGTLFSLGNLNITTDEELSSYLKTFWFPGASDSDIKEMLKLYPSDPAEGSPFGTGQMNAFTPENKRIAAIQGDWFFNAPRRRLLDKFSSIQPVYNFCKPGDMTDYFIHFVNHLDPSSASGVQWPRYNSSARLTLQFNDGNVPLNVTVDNARLAGTSMLASLSLRFPF
ncbi:carotenoid ester lipase precursor [Lentinus tigrinus ALCF2SS1-6]|uniref:Carboxylic ester hydrolase n=1 Tax=Lentinus tigrinus ALCF2SS1-6 TaxID=1328759 RepID=A0A5C2S519_9APHY|nr:carotenoid ester lipase precursor [Lentinus tigrinus ALCF2SS1-6]